MQIYQMFSPEQTARESLLAAQVEGQRAQNRGLDQAWTQNELVNPIALGERQAALEGVRFGNRTAQDEAPLRLEALRHANRGAAAAYTGQVAENDFNRQIRPFQLGQAEKSDKLAGGLLDNQLREAAARATAIENENLLFPATKRLTEGKAQEQSISNEHAPGVYQMQQRSQAAQIMAMLAGAGYSSDTNDPRAIAQQDLLRAIGGNAIPSEMTPGANIFTGVPEGDRRLMSTLGQASLSTERAFESNAPAMTSLARKYPDAWRTSMPTRTQDLIRMYMEDAQPDLSKILKRYEQTQR